MSRHWSFGQRIAAGFAVTVALAIAIAFVSVNALRSVIAGKDRVIEVEARLLIDAQALETEAEGKVASARGYLLAQEERFLTTMRSRRDLFLQALERARGGIATEEGRRLLDAVARAEEAHQVATDQVVAMRRTDAPIGVVSDAFEQQVIPARDRLGAAIEAFVSHEEQVLADATQASTAAAAAATTLVMAISVVLVLGAVVLGVVFTRSLGRQIGTAVGQVQSSSTELQAAANQQATGAREQATAMSEISTTMSELLATSRQITESAQRVAQIAHQTATSAQEGDEVVEQAQQSIAAIRRHTDLIVNHMVELGQKSQQIGGVLDIVSELAEQTNILSINAAIEAAGAGAAGRRFAVVADEIRKLADRVTVSTKEIRGLVDDVRGAVNTTVMATETGSKAVEAGSERFGRVAASFRQIRGLVATTTEAAREIELSTKQQATAVEQVNAAIANIAQASKETEASSTQTLQTASQLAGLSKDLLRLVQPQAA